MRRLHGSIVSLVSILCFDSKPLIGKKIQRRDRPTQNLVHKIASKNTPTFINEKFLGRGTSK